MDKTYKLIIILLVTALVFSAIGIAVKNYFPQLRVGGQGTNYQDFKGVPEGNLKLEILPQGTPAPQTGQ